MRCSICQILWIGKRAHITWRTQAKGDADYVSILRKSDFMSQRYMTSSDEVIKTTKTKLQQPGLRMLEAGQKFGDLLTWWTAYAKYESNPSSQEAMYRDYANAIDYADDVTRRSVAGRGLGEIPLVLQSKTANLLTPFQIEVNNMYLTAKEQLGKALSKQSTPAQRKVAAAGIAQYEIGAFLFNMATRALFGDDLLGFDFIHVLTDAIKDLTDDDKDESVLENVVQNTLGTIMEGLPFVSFVIPQLMDAETSEKIFGADQDPSRYGTGTLGTNAIGKGISLIIDATKGKAELWDVIDMIASFVPFGGRQAARTAKGISTVAQGRQLQQGRARREPASYNSAQIKGAGDYRTRRGSVRQMGITRSAGIR